MPAFIGSDLDDSVTGSLWADTIQGGGGDDVLSGGGGGGDRLEGGLGDDIYFFVDYYGDEFIEQAGEGIDTLVWTVGEGAYLSDNIEILRMAGAGLISGAGNEGDNTLYGNDNDNWLYGNGGADMLVGGLGADRLEGGAGADTLHGGDGDDVYLVSGPDDVVVEYAGEGMDTVHVAEVDAPFAATPYVLAANVETLIWDFYAGHSGPFSRIMVGNSLDNLIVDDAYGNDAVMQGEGGDDQIHGGWDDDRVEGGAGNDWLAGDYNVDTLNGGAGADLFVANAYIGQDVIEDFTVGVDKIDLLDGMAVKEIVQEGADARIIFEPVYSFDDSMLLEGVDAADLDLERDFVTDVQPGELDEVSRASVPGQTLTGGASFDYLRGDWGADLIDGGAGADDLYGNAGRDTLIGGAGKDILDGEEGNDVLRGGADSDIYLVRDAGDEIVELAGEGARDEVRAYFDGYTLADNVERLDLRYGSAQTAFGNSGANFIYGNRLNNILDGGAGNDDLYGDEGADQIVGGDGDDRLDGGVDGPGTSETNYRNIPDTLTGGAGADRFVAGFRFENDFEPNGADIVTDFTDGKDLIEAWGVLGWESIQSIVNEDGTEDTLVVFDDMEYFDASLLLKGVSADQITAEDFIFGYNGTSFADTILGTNNNDRIDAGDGADVLKGNGGSDEMIGGAGNDIYYADGNDEVVEDGGAGSDQVVASSDYTLGDNVEDLKLAEAPSAPAGALAAPGSAAKVGRGNDLDNRIDGNSLGNKLWGQDGNDRLLGKDGADRLLGGDGRDRLEGGAGRDVLTGGEGRDLLIGGDGADTFRFTQLTDGGDTLRGFDAGAGDVIDLSLLDANLNRDGDQAVRFADHFTGRAGQAVLTYDAGQDRTLMQLDADGDGAADFSLTIAGQIGADLGWVL